MSCWDNTRPNVEPGNGQTHHSTHGTKQRWVSTCARSTSGEAHQTPVDIHLEWGRWERLASCSCHVVLERVREVVRVREEEILGEINALEKTQVLRLSNFPVMKRVGMGPA